MSLAVEFDGIDLDRDGASPVAASLLLRFFMPEGLAFGELQNLIGSLPPVSSCTSLGIKGIVRHSRVHLNLLLPDPSERGRRPSFSLEKNAVNVKLVI